MTTSERDEVSGERTSAPENLWQQLDPTTRAVATNVFAQMVCSLMAAQLTESTKNPDKALIDTRVNEPKAGQS